MVFATMRICMSSDFFYPNMGGVEEHIFNLSQCLIAQGHKVIILTHSYGDRKGVRYMTNGLKIYYLPIQTFYNQCILPTMICNIPLLRYILIRERIDIVHGHSAFSALAHEAMLIGKLLGMRAVFTDHSLFGFADLSAIVTNKFLEIALSTCNHCICVSHIGKENTVLRAHVPENQVSVIPNAVDTAFFTPNPIKRPNDNTITIVVVSRLVYRKGVDLLAGVISKISQMNHLKKVNFLIGGDGPKRALLEEIREKNNMQDRVTLLGALEHSKVRDVLTQGHIFLNTSLTEAYCMAIVEAASCGLQVVSTKVGGIPEVLPSNLIILTDANVESVLNGVLIAIERQRYSKSRKQSVSSDKNKTYCTLNGYYTNLNLTNGKLKNGTMSSKNDEKLQMSQMENYKMLCPFKCNDIVTNLYNWKNITFRTEKVYKRVLKEPDKPLGKKLLSYLRSGVWPFLLVVSLCHLIIKILDWLVPEKYIDIAKDFTSSRSKSRRKKYD